MSIEAPAQIVIWAPPRVGEKRVHGTGGWHAPDERRDLDWLTFACLCGWEAKLAGSEAALALHAASPELRWIVVASPESLPAAAVERLEKLVRERPVLLVTPAPASKTPLARVCGVAQDDGASPVMHVRWQGPAEAAAWLCRNGFEARHVSYSEDVEMWATASGKPVVLARPCGKGVVVTLAFDASDARDRDGAATALLKHVLIFGSKEPVAWFDWSATLVLRMDDPGGAQNVHSRSWRYPKLGRSAWAAIANELASRGARLSIAYVPAWVDDGDAARGTLQVAGDARARIPGAVYPSSEVSYRDSSGEQPCASSDYRDERAGIQALRSRGLGDVELHGYTHMHPDRAAWLRADDRYDSTVWYRELGANASAAIAAAGAPHPVEAGAASLRAQFGTSATTLVCPGDEWSEAALERALDIGVSLVSSYYLAIRHHDALFWTTHVCGPYLDEPDEAWFDSGLPVVGYFHDREPALLGVRWLTQCLDRWGAAGARRWIDFREVASAVSRRLYVTRAYGELRLAIHESGAPPIVRGLEVHAYVPVGHSEATSRFDAPYRNVPLTRSGTRGAALLEPTAVTA